MAAMGGGGDAELLSAAEILVSLRSRKLLAWPEWVWPATQPAAGEASSAVPRKPRSKPSRLRAESASTSASRELEQGRAGAAAAAAAAGSGARPGGSDPSASAPARAQRPGHAGDEPSKESMDASSPVTPLDYSAGGSGASSSADDAARPPAKRKGAGSRASAAAPSGAGGDDEGCSSPAKRARVVEEQKPATAISVLTEPSMQRETTSGKGAPLLFDLNELPLLEDYDDGGLGAS